MKYIILDRDGVINHDRDDYVKSAAEWVPIDGSLEAMARLNHAGFGLVVATNQSGVGRGLFDMATLNAMHEKMHRLLAQVGGKVDAIFFCPHAPEDGCDCRKPKPGMYLDIARRFNLKLEQVVVIGDSLRDLQAAVEVGAQPVLVKTGKGERTLAKGGLPADTPVFADLAEAADQLISQLEQD